MNVLILVIRNMDIRHKTFVKKMEFVRHIDSNESLSPQLHPSTHNMCVVRVFLTCISRIHYTMPAWLGRGLVCVTSFLLCFDVWSCYSKPGLCFCAATWSAQISFLLTCATKSVPMHLHIKDLLVMKWLCFFFVLFFYSFSNWQYIYMA